MKNLNISFYKILFSLIIFLYSCSYTTEKDDHPLLSNLSGKYMCGFKVKSSTLEGQCEITIGEYINNKTDILLFFPTTLTEFDFKEIDVDVSNKSKLLLAGMNSALGITLSGECIPPEINLELKDGVDTLLIYGNK